MKLDRKQARSLAFGTAGACLGGLINAWILDIPWPSALIGTAIGVVLGESIMWAWRSRRANRDDRLSYNCASCGEHFPSPCITVTLGGEFQAEDTKHAGVLVVWCKACAPEDALHAVFLRHVHSGDADAAVGTLAAMAERGPGRVTWLSQATLDRIREIGKMPVHPVTDHRTVH